MDRRGWPPRDRQSDIYLPQQVAADFRERLGSWENFEFLASQNVVRLHVLQDGEAFTLDRTRVLPVRLAADYVYAFLLEEEGKRVLIAPDELVGWDPPQAVRGLDLAVLPMGVPEFDPFTGARMVPAEHPVLQVEAPGPALWRSQAAGKTRIMTHIEEPFGLSHDDCSGWAQSSRRTASTSTLLRHPTSRGVTQRGTMTSMDYDQLAKPMRPIARRTRRR